MTMRGSVIEVALRLRASVGQRSRGSGWLPCTSVGSIGVPTSCLWCFREVLGVDAREVAPFSGYRALLEDRVYRARWLAGAAINALVRVNIILLVFLTSMDTIHGTNIHAGCVLHADAGLADHVGHTPMIPLPETAHSDGWLMRAHCAHTLIIAHSARISMWQHTSSLNGLPSVSPPRRGEGLGERAVAIILQSKLRRRRASYNAADNARTYVAQKPRPRGPN